MRMFSRLLAGVTLMVMVGPALAGAEGPTTTSTMAPSQVKAPDFFVIGVWQQPPKNFPLWSGRGINTIVTNVPKPDGTQDRADYFRKAGQNNLWVAINPDPQEPKRDLAFPNFLAWTQRDEPENWGALKKSDDGKFDVEGSIKQYKDKYDLLKKASPKTPVWGNFNGMQITGSRDKRDLAKTPIIKADYPEFMAGCDWLSADWYPNASGRGPARIGELIGGMTKLMSEWSGGGKPCFIFVECCEQGLKNTPNPPRAPTAEEMRAIAWTGVIHGARGIIYFPLKVVGGFSWDNTPAELVDPMVSLNSELRAYERFILQGKRVTKDGDPKEGSSATWTLADGSTLTATITRDGEKWTTTLTAAGKSAPPAARLKAPPPKMIPVRKP